MNLVARFSCPDCKIEQRGITYGGLPVQFFVGRFPHKKDCPGAGDIWIQVYEGLYEDAPPSVDEPVDNRHEAAQRHWSPTVAAFEAPPEMVERLAGLEESDLEGVLAGCNRPRNPREVQKMTPMLDRGYASVRVVEEHIEVQLVDEDRAIGIVFRQAAVGEVIDGEVLDAPDKITLTMSKVLAHALLEKLAAADINSQ